MQISTSFLKCNGELCLVDNIPSALSNLSKYDNLLQPETSGGKYMKDKINISQVEKKFAPCVYAPPRI